MKRFKNAGIRVGVANVLRRSRDELERMRAEEREPYNPNSGGIDGIKGRVKCLPNRPLSKRERMEEKRFINYLENLLKK